MHPILFKIPLFDGLTIFTYGALVAFGFFMGILYISYESKRVGEDPAKALDLVFWIIVAALIGSRAYYVLVTEPGILLGDPLALVKIWKGGLVFQGGVLGAFIVGIWWIRRHKLPLFKYLDIFAPAIPLGHFFGRLGCFMSGCCHGRTAPAGSWLAVIFPADPSSFAPSGGPLYATQLMEAAGELAIFLALFFFRKHKRFDGQLMVLYMAAYAILRFVVEFYRGVETRNLIFGTFSVAQLVSVIMVIFAVWIWVRQSRKAEGL
ncbi:MAG: prolipoprotein diacylglyceryl transferase [Deltaproteobacteria bacterium CG11_big_fil_rev_8_21_14_0_20_49_13]|nr:MAG: prolipoprotein diacylglyceryl transferase [Deltaproteobacteria bacterium CG11_big_fil_rev_8_21_14_0_20_49_13]